MLGVRALLPFMAAGGATGAELVASAFSAPVSAPPAWRDAAQAARIATPENDGVEMCVGACRKVAAKFEADDIVSMQGVEAIGARLVPSVRFRAQSAFAFRVNTPSDPLHPGTVRFNVRHCTPPVTIVVEAA